MAGQTFDINIESVSLYLNGASEYVDYEVEEVGDSGQVYLGRDGDGNLVAVEIYAPIRLTTEKTPMRVATRYMQQEKLNGEAETDRDPEMMADTAHRTAAEGGTGWNQTARGAGLRGESAESLAANRDMKSGMVVNPNTSEDSGRDVMDAHGRDQANGSVGRHGVANDYAQVSPGAEGDSANAEEVADPNRSGQSLMSRQETAAGDDKKAVETRKKSEENAQKKVDERSDALASVGDIQENSSEAAKLAATNSEEEEAARKDEKKTNDKDVVATMDQDTANTDSSSSKKKSSAKTPEEKAV